MCGIFYKASHTESPNEDKKPRLVGVCGYHPIDTVNKSLTIGYWISEDFQGLGIVTSFTKFLVDYAFEKLSINKVAIPAAEQNYKSQAVSKRLGLTNEGIDREAEYLYGRFVNHVRFIMLKSEWEVLHNS